MMKRFILLLVAILVCIPSIQARRKTPKAGTVKDGVYQDVVYNFKITLPKNWEISVKKKDDPVRCVLIKKNYQIPPEYQDAEDYTQVPRLTLYVAKTPMSAVAFRDSLVSKSYDSHLKNDILKYFDILNDQNLGEGTTREPVVTKSRPVIYVDSLPAAVWTGECRYFKNVTISVSSQSTKRVVGGYSGGIAVVKNGDTMLLFHVMTEENYFDQNWNEVMSVIRSLKWPPVGQASGDAK